jgi:hypothetical protein
MAVPEGSVEGPGAAAEVDRPECRDLAGLFGPGRRSERTAMLSTNTGNDTVGN